ncbi:hypothetical protein HMPREF9336_01411 [Segniliparus rugosus ATCC BAA-974]|uniref:Uncharacterized protein n=2 Tax=Segniliparus rugosus TaxID=286804 RepID=E5XPI9_SEGRC|nr:hypothetical protein HMPREF9336_01411 [Segniliparus rugosus ATCC BAA-974]
MRAILDVATHAVISKLPHDRVPPLPWDFQSMLDLSFASGEEHTSRFAVALLAEQKAIQMVEALPLSLRADVLAVQMEDEIQRDEERNARAADERAARSRALNAERLEREQRYAEVVAKRADFPARFAAFQAVYRQARRV